VQRATQRYLRFGVRATVRAHVARAPFIHRTRVEALGPRLLARVAARCVRHDLADSALDSPAGGGS
jgi:hypothetical protein